MASSSSSSGVQRVGPGRGGVVEQYDLSPRAAADSGEAVPGRQLRAAGSDPSDTGFRKRRTSESPVDKPGAWVGGAPLQIVGPTERTDSESQSSKSPRTTHTRSNPDPGAREMLALSVSRNQSDDAVGINSDGRDGHDLNMHEVLVSGGGTGLANQSIPMVTPSGMETEAGDGGPSSGRRSSGRATTKQVFEKFVAGGKRCMCRDRQGQQCVLGGEEPLNISGHLEVYGVVFAGEGFSCLLGMPRVETWSSQRDYAGPVD